MICQIKKQALKKFSYTQYTNTEFDFFCHSFSERYQEHYSIKINIILLEYSTEISKLQKIQNTFEEYLYNRLQDLVTMSLIKIQDFLQKQIDNIHASISIIIKQLQK
ncbi:hypothetical protein pb186bvf_020750, partial [Paramecium bursaria]